VVAAVDGLVSGMSTGAVIQQLMAVESQGQARLKTKVTERQNTSSALQSINVRASALKSATTAVLNADNWKLTKGTSSDSSALSVTAGAGATPGQLTVAVTSLAKNHVRTVDVAAAGPITTGTGKITITTGAMPGGTPHDVTITTDTAAGVASAINAAGLDVKAAVVNADGGRTVLQLTSTKTGAASEFTVAGLSAGGGSVVSQGTDAQLSVGSGPGAYTVSSSTNTFVNALPNVTFTALKEQAGINVTVTTDVDGIAAKVASMVDAANGMLADIDAKAVLGGQGRSAGPLAGNPLVRQLATNVLSTTAAGKTDYGSFSQLGVELTRTGRLSFDKAKFVQAYQADPAKVQKALTDATGGLATMLDKGAASAKDQLESATQSQDSAVRSLNTEIERWDARLKLRKDALQRQFSGLETALGKLKDQSSWLSGQLAHLG
jgi:flagellar hook-associated protein 2